MHLKTAVIQGQRIDIRPVLEEDLELLMSWWNDGRIMVSVGFPNGLGLTMEQMRRDWEKWNNDSSAMRLIVCLDTGAPIGETCFHDYDPEMKQTEIGLKICKPELWEHGYGTETLKLMTDYAFEHLGIEHVLLNPSKTNARIIRVNEKCGYRTIGEKQGGLLMELKRKDWENITHTYI